VRLTNLDSSSSFERLLNDGSSTSSAYTQVLRARLNLVS
jgi:hypothetical protein